MAPHHPETPHWYLGVLATASERQGQGFGSAVAEPGIDAAAVVGLPAFLETGVERNVALYERMGFVVTGVIYVPDLPAGGACAGTRLRGGDRDPEHRVVGCDARKLLVRGVGVDAVEEHPDFHLPAPEVGAHLGLVLVRQLRRREHLGALAEA